MRRLLAVLAIAAVVGCGSDNVLAPVTKVDGTWTGSASVYQLSIGMVQDDSGNVVGNASMAGQLGVVNGTVAGTFVYPNLQLSLDMPGYESMTFNGVMSTTAARIDGALDGSGFTDLQISLNKK